MKKIIKAVLGLSTVCVAGSLSANEKAELPKLDEANSMESLFEATGVNINKMLSAAVVKFKKSVPAGKKKIACCGKCMGGCAIRKTRATQKTRVGQFY